jgi:S-adenosylmethionine uptake transporter
VRRNRDRSGSTRSFHQISIVRRVVSSLAPALPASKSAPNAVEHQAKALYPALIGETDDVYNAAAYAAPVMNARPHLPHLTMLLAIALFSVMDATMKHASIAVGAYSATLLRSVIGFALVLPLWLRLGASWPGRKVLVIHLKRGLVGVATATSFFYALVRLPMAEAIAISFVAPLIALFLASLLLHERIARKSITASVVGLIGVLVIVGGRAGGHEMDPEAIHGTVAVLVSASLYAWYLILQRQQALVAGPREVVVFQYGVAVISLGVGAPWMLQLPAAVDWGNIGASAVLGVSALMLSSWSYRRAETQALVPYEYSAFLWAALMGWLVFGEAVTATTVVGVGLIIAGCLIAAPRKHIEQTAL